MHSLGNILKMEHNSRKKIWSSKIKCWVSFSEFGDICKTKNKSCWWVLLWFSPIYLNWNSTICYSLAVKVPANHVIKTVLTVSLLKTYRNFKRGHVLKGNCGTQVSFFLSNPTHWVSYAPLCSHHGVPPQHKPIMQWAVNWELKSPNL